MRNALFTFRQPLTVAEFANQVEHHLDTRFEARALRYRKTKRSQGPCFVVGCIPNETDGQVTGVLIQYIGGMADSDITLLNQFDLFYKEGDELIIYSDKGGRLD